MKIMRSVFFVFMLIGSTISGECVSDEQINVAASLENALKVLSCDTQLYAQLQSEIDKIAQEFDTSAEMRRRLQCCVTYKFDNLNQNFTFREDELLAIIAEKDQEIADLQESYENFQARAAAEIEELSQVVEILTAQLAAYQDAQGLHELQVSVQEIMDLFAQVQSQYLQMHKERSNFLLKLEGLANKAYGHFELEAIENNSFGDLICGTLYCPMLDDQAAVEQNQTVQEEVVVLEIDEIPTVVEQGDVDQFEDTTTYDVDVYDIMLTDTYYAECPDKCFDLLLTGSICGFFECVVDTVEDFIEQVF